MPASDVPFVVDVDGLPADYRLRVATEGGHLELSPAGASTAPPPDGRPVWFVGAWNPGGRPATLTVNRQRLNRLAAAVASSRFGRSSAALYPARLSWAEPLVALTGVTDSEAQALSARFRQPCWYRWDPTGLHVIAGGEARQTASVAVASRPFAPCPMRTGQDESQELCTRPGGPWTSSSRTAAAFFERDREVLFDVLGCDVCHGGPVNAVTGTPILLHEWTVASRYGPPRRAGVRRSGGG